MKKSLFLLLILTVGFKLSQAQCTMTISPQTVYGTPGTYTIGTGQPLYVQVCSNVTVYDTLGSNQKKYYLLPGASLVLKGTFSQFVYMQGGSSLTRIGTSGGTNYVYYEPTATVNGTFQTNTTTCTAVSFPTLSCSPSTGIREYHGNDLLKVYPNPANERLIITCDFQASTSALIYNAIGELVLSNVLNKGENAINTSELNPGIYFIQYKSQNKVVARSKFVISR